MGSVDDCNACEFLVLACCAVEMALFDSVDVACPRTDHGAFDSASCCGGFVTRFPSSMIMYSSPTIMRISSSTTTNARQDMYHQHTTLPSPRDYVSRPLTEIVVIGRERFARWIVHELREILVVLEDERADGVVVE